MKLLLHCRRILLAAFVAILSLPATASAAEVLVSVGKLTVTARDLDMALASSPFSTQINTMDEDDQAGLRGDMLRRLVAARLLTLEAKRLGLDKSAAYLKELNDFRLSLLYRHYMEKLRARIEIPASTLNAMKEHFKNDADGLAAAKSAFVSEQYLAIRQATLINLRLRADTAIHADRIKPPIPPETVLMEGTGLRITYGDIADPADSVQAPTPESIKERLNARADLLLVARAAQSRGVDVGDKLKEYAAERLPALLLDRKAREWIPDEATLRSWYDKHPDVAKVAERRHVGQLVVATRAEAEQLRQRILNGESLFTLAGQLSIDPVGRKQNGDIGWMTAGRGQPELDQALSQLADNQVSEVIQSKPGFHLLTILERQPGRIESFEEIHDRVRQIVIGENLRPYLVQLEQRYPVNWKVLKPRDPPPAATAVPAT
jgi:parvulin-like peptidyl-prolyl isomerase